MRLTLKMWPSFSSDFVFFLVKKSTLEIIKATISQQKPTANEPLPFELETKK